jgi:hypothetical protein
LLAATTLQPLPRIYGLAITTFSISRIIILTLYASVTLYLLTLVDAPLLSDHFLDDVAFRAAWVTITQIPLVYLLSAKCGPFDLITGISHERMNWVHRWVGRMILVSATAHVVIMKSSISTTDILKSHDEAMTVVRYGIATYTMLIWIAVSSIIPLRRWSYRVFYINHYISTFAFLSVAFQHVPTYARPPLFLAVGIVVLDRFLIVYFFIRNNISIGPPVYRFARSRSGRRFIAGFPVRMTTPSAQISSLPMQTLGETTTTIRIANIPFTWKPGQHVRLYIPALGRFETHPFTPANCSAVPPPPLPPRKDLENGRTLEQPKQTSEMILMIKSKSGFTRRLAEYHKTWLARPCPNATEPADGTLTAYIDGPYGVAPTWHAYENLVLVASSTGVSFILSILDHLEQLCFTASPDEIKTRKVKVVWTLRHLDPAYEEVVKQLVSRCGATLRDCGMRFEAEFYATCADSKLQEQGEVRYDPFAHLRPQLPRRVSERPALRIRHPDEIYDEWDREQEMEDLGLKYEDAEPSPFVTTYDSSEEAESEGDEHSTLVDGEEERHEDWANTEDPFSDELAMRNDDAYRPLPLPTKIHTSASEDKESVKCQCALIQHQRRKLNTKERNVECIVRYYGERPDIQKMLDMMQPASGTRTMVAVCGNVEVVRKVQCTTARMNKDFAFGRAGRNGRVDVWVEGQG